MRIAKTVEDQSFGINSIVFENDATAYVKKLNTDQGPHYGVFDTNGIFLAAFSTQNAALCAAEQNDFKPVLLH